MTLRVAVVGAGPAGYYATEALAKAEGVEVDLIDRLPTPYGLIRSGVAPDHQKTKNVTKRYDQTAALPNVRYVGNVTLGQDISMAEMEELYDAVVLSFGTEGDRPIGIAGEDKKGVYGSFEYVGWYNGHPDFTGLDPELNIESAVVIGNGNVALDCARLLVRTGNELRESDIAPSARSAITASPVSDVHVLGRRGPVQASFSIAEMREMDELEQAISLVHDAQIPESMPDDMDPREAKPRQRVLDVLKGFRGNDPASQSKRVHFEFFSRPVEIMGDDHVTGIRVEETRLEDGKAVGTGNVREIPCQLVIGCIGYQAREVEGLPFKWGILENVEGRVRSGVYCVGWVKRGPSGTIGTNRPDAQDVVARLLEDFADGGTDKPGATGLDALLANRGVRTTSYADWETIDAAEVANAPDGAPREKFLTVEAMLDTLKG